MGSVPRVLRMLISPSYGNFECEGIGSHFEISLGSPGFITDLYSGNYVPEAEAGHSSQIKQYHSRLNLHIAIKLQWRFKIMKFSSTLTGC